MSQQKGMSPGWFGRAGKEPKGHGQIVRQISFTQERFRGPIPDPSALERYGRIDPGLPGRIMAMAEQQSVHRQTLELRTVESHVRAQDRGQWIAGFIACVAFATAGYCAHVGHADVALKIVGFNLLSLVGLFVYGKERNLSRTKPVPTQRGPEVGTP